MATRVQRIEFEYDDSIITPREVQMIAAIVNLRVDLLRVYWEHLAGLHGEREQLNVTALDKELADDTTEWLRKMFPDLPTIRVLAGIG
jgi:hypothetical protein